MTRLGQLYALRDQIDTEIRTLERRIGIRPTTLDKAHRIINQTADHHGVTVEEITAGDGDRRHRVTRARREAAWRLRRDLNLTYMGIADLLGVHHSSVLYAVRKADLEHAQAV
jgi:chromosomal replication initiation ATPase DnaA